MRLSYRERRRGQRSRGCQESLRVLGKKSREWGPEAEADPPSWAGLHLGTCGEGSR